MTGKMQVFLLHLTCRSITNSDLVIYTCIGFCFKNRLIFFYTHTFSKFYISRDDVVCMVNYLGKTGSSCTQQNLPQTFADPNHLVVYYFLISLIMDAWQMEQKDSTLHMHYS